MKNDCLDPLSAWPGRDAAPGHRASTRRRRSGRLRRTSLVLIGCIVLGLAGACGPARQDPPTDEPSPAMPDDTGPHRGVSSDIDVHFENGARLISYEIRPQRQSPGAAFELVFHWDALPDTMPDTLAMFVHLRGEHFLFQADHHLTPERTSYVQTVTIPDEAPPGLYRIRIGLYDTATGQRVKTSTRLPRRRHAVILPDQLEIPAKQH